MSDDEQIRLAVFEAREERSGKSRVVGGLQLINQQPLFTGLLKKRVPAAASPVFKPLLPRFAS